MFGFFKGKSIKKSIEIAKDATIDCALEQGIYAGFMVQLKVGKDEVGKHWKNQEALTAFVEEIENRIEADDFDYPLDPLPGGLIREGDSGKKTALRAVFAPGHQLLMKWNK